LAAIVSKPIAVCFEPIQKNGETKKVTFEATIPFAELNMNENPENRPEKNWHNFLTFKIKGDSSVALKVLNGEFSPRFE